ncbi:hypothetical protein CFC21_105819 [Triticum aestivum]|uniref:Disease resistance R13L4/SHOC-2-like LRR domain-containing protein n=2 Tax=Triticum aestivum TaxID=4565 RepID=A0A3B6SL97_WHEAT|nr:hypothetical protein CFC21_105819 [Triticum aestivum]
MNFDLHMNSVDNLTGLSELRNLRSLNFCCDHAEHTTSQHGIHMDIFWCSVAKLLCCNLRNPGSASNIFCPPSVELASLITSNSESNLMELHVAATWMFPRVPIWTGQFQKLSTLGICVEKMMPVDFDLLAGLPNLLHLWLWIRKSPEMRIIIHGGAMAFKLLKYLRITCFAPCLTFMAGAVSELQTLELDIHEDGGERHGPSTIQGVEHLSRLRQVDVYIHFEGADTESQRRAADAEAILKNVISVYPGHPSINIRPTDNRNSLCKIHELSSDTSDRDEEAERQVDRSAEAATHAPAAVADGSTRNSR